jgi:hypothetical protein
VAEQESVPSGTDTRIPNVARMYDYAASSRGTATCPGQPAVSRPHVVDPAGIVRAVGERMSAGSYLVEPGLTAVTQGRGDELDEKLDAAGQWWLDGVGRKN